MLRFCLLFPLPRVQRICFHAALFEYFLILAVGSVPGARQDIGKYASGTVLHTVAYALLGALLFVGVRGSGFRRAIAAMISVSAMGALDEAVQSFLPYRTAAFGDWVMDSVAGAVISIFLWSVWPHLLIRKASSN